MSILSRGGVFKKTQVCGGCRTDLSNCGLSLQMKIQQNSLFFDRMTGYLDVSWGNMPTHKSCASRNIEIPTYEHIHAGEKNTVEKV